MPEQELLARGAEEIAEEEARRRRWRRRGRNAMAASAAIIVLVLLLDLWVVRGPAERAFLVRNLACLRCHTELIPARSILAVHRPFLIETCLSCHVPCARIVRGAVTPGDFSAFDRIRNALRRLGLQFVWQIVSGPAGFPDPVPEAPRISEEASVTPGGTRVPVEELCAACHPSIGPELAMAFRHAPFEERRCMSCHEPHASNFRRLLKGTDATVCTECHEIASELDQPVVHEPFGEVRCTGCHQAHASENASILKREERSLCTGCHDEIGALDARGIRHQPFRRGCVRCHRPHSAARTALLVDSLPRLCYGCHARIRNDFSLPSAHPVGSRINCDDCHASHASDYRGLLVTAQRPLCSRCHRQIPSEVKAPVVHDPFADSPCTTSCHRPHGSRYSPLLSDEDPPLCFGCHPALRREIAKRSSHPIGERMRCGSCHRPHASQVYSLLVQRLDGLCYRCHPKDKLYGPRQSIPGYDSHTRPHRRRGRAPSGGWPDDNGAHEKAPVLMGRQHDEIRCMGCHRPHGSDFTPILKQANPDVCLACHLYYANRNYHPTRPSLYDPLAKRGLTCSSSCHNPHGSPYYRMLRYPYEVAGYGSDHLCLLCHEGVGVWY
ncbi:MAG: hypothetical protein C4521_13205 [Actinobacteria bacterium]|nr:MAG: hypothetical protein C4521_13205 [Actinomycetota bacterium]